ncbi:C2H2-type domain-containing protein [Caenorhabditis elegans]|uniref:C2H2-type domain-containing protein n=1 Tax=Caenorhabditis elegans TaxID=6239 RepID=Q9TZK7_CAEEL|nr:C2H2-type domain-containing protein [Caenorhabditis elegans]CCD66883.2 C2H2-type domain-containing protein [Caenorhabditis elegans]|eukprot:NP_001337274.1 Uncharacterized protein CELE_C36C9.4 [Caenorhabditis elegans]
MMLDDDLGDGAEEMDMGDDDQIDYPVDELLEFGDSGDVEDAASEMRQMLRDASTPALLHVASACVSRYSNLAFKRSLLSLDESVAESANSIWTYNKNNFSTHHFCNKCGKVAQNSKKCKHCGGPVASFVRVGSFTQIVELVETYMDDILELREQLKNDRNLEHNLASPFFSSFRETESPNRLRLSLVVSIDGVRISGNKKKLWPVSYIIFDLPTGLMQKSTNIVLGGIVECSENPTTTLWNALIPFILSDVESHTGKVRNTSFTCHIRPCSADQPAKRAFFGFMAHQSAESCFFCMSPGTLYKFGDRKRREERPGYETIVDSEQGVHGFGPIPAKIVPHVLPYNTPIDILHNLGEGIYTFIRKELLLSEFKKIKPRSPPFSNNKGVLKEAFRKVVLHSNFTNVEACRNGTDKTNFFRIVICLVALSFDTLSPEARVVIVGLGMLGNEMYTNSKASCLFEQQMAAGAAWFLSEANVEYLSIKAHEVLFHLPEINELFGNTGSLSTFSFESFYQFALCGYSSRTTRSFVQNASTKVLLHTSIRREIAFRVINEPTTALQKFVALTPDIVPVKSTWKNEKTFGVRIAEIKFLKVMKISFLKLI